MSATQVIYTLWLREMKWFLRGKTRIIQSVVQPFLWLAIIGIGMSSAFKLPGGQSYLQFMAPGIIGMTLIFSSIMSGVSVLWDKQFGFLKEILVAPVARTHIMLGKALGGVTTSLLQGLLLLIAAALVGVWPPTILALAQVMVFMIFISLAFVSLGLAFASKMTDPVAFPLVANFLVMPLFFLSGALFPLATAPDWMKAIAYVNPLRYGVDGLRGAIIGLSDLPLWVDFGVLLVFSTAMILIGGYLFRKTSI
ncbi:MAG: multidrug ABC transporter permease [Candidatus Hadarchaeum yellowstonense]|jgi:ABC-2 type transport system permease protein|uniref:Multidrug ABC transporter permease n=1 Tax=Hadarchaeum yellowstonense TaxID=1776334 RepID=A0A147JWL0_HADYE|nr:MAG: multidrug ABC transporter permease [Candidatus Hadarchaeum yellowstonense]